MKIAIATREFATVAGHAGRAREWLVYECRPGEEAPQPIRVSLDKSQILHLADERAPHPLDGVELVVAGSAGEGFVRHMQRRGADVLLTGETDPQRALRAILAGEALPDPRPDLLRALCKVRDLFSRH